MEIAQATEESRRASMAAAGATFADDDDIITSTVLLGNNNNNNNSQYSSSCCTMRRFKMALCGVGLLFVIIVIAIPATVLVRANADQQQKTATTPPIMGTKWANLGGSTLELVSTATSVDLSDDGFLIAIGSANVDNDIGQVDVKKYDTERDEWISVGDPLVGDTEGEQFGHRVLLRGKGNDVVLLVSGVGKSVVRSYYLSPDYQQYEWIQFGNTVEGDSPDDKLGHSISMNDEGTAFLVGTDVESTLTGYAVLYQLSLDGSRLWEPVKRFGGDGIPGSRWGYSVALSGDGNTACMGEPNYRVLGYQTSTGRVKCFTTSFTNNKMDWSETRGVELIGTFGNGNFGTSLAINRDGSVLAVGDMDGNALEDNIQEGSVVVYQFRDNNWHPYGNRLAGAGTNDGRGFQVQLNAQGNVLAWTATGYDTKTASNIGLVRVAQYLSEDWYKLAHDITGIHASDFVGGSVALSGTGTMVALTSSNPHLPNSTLRTYALLQ